MTLAIYSVSYDSPKYVSISSSRTSSSVWQDCWFFLFGQPRVQWDLKMLQMLQNGIRRKELMRGSDWSCKRRKTSLILSCNDVCRAIFCVNLRMYLWVPGLKGWIRTCKNQFRFPLQQQQQKWHRQKQQQKIPFPLFFSNIVKHR